MPHGKFSYNIEKLLRKQTRHYGHDDTNGGCVAAIDE